MKRNISVAALLLILLICAFLLTECNSPTKGAFLTVEQSQCMGCNQCGYVCNSDAVRILNGKAVIDPTKCVECGKCVDVCPVNAIY